MKKIVLVPMLMILSATSFSQTTFLSIGPQLALPGSNSGLSRNAGTGLGGSLRIEYTEGNYISGIATIGYLGFAQQELLYSGTPPTTVKTTAIPIQAGIKYYPVNTKVLPQGFFISLELGLIPTTTHFDYAVYPDLTFKEAGFSTAPGLGYQTQKIESGFSLQYDLSASGFNVYYYNFRLAYRFLKTTKKHSSHQKG